MRRKEEGEKVEEGEEEKWAFVVINEGFKSIFIILS